MRYKRVELWVVQQGVVILDVANDAVLGDTPDLRAFGLGFVPEVVQELDFFGRIGAHQDGIALAPKEGNNLLLLILGEGRWLRCGAQRESLRAVDFLHGCGSWTAQLRA